MTQRATSRSAPARELVRRAAVLGAGTMGAQIAGHLANNGIPCLLLDLPSDPARPGGKGGRNQLAEAARERLLKLRPAPLYSPDSLQLITAAGIWGHSSPGTNLASPQPSSG